MEMTCAVRDRELTICLLGELDHHAARGIISYIEQRIEQNLPCKLILDFANLSFMDSSGIAVVLRAKRKMETMQGNLAVVNIPRHAAKVLETAGMGRYMDLT